MTENLSMSLTIHGQEDASAKIKNIDRALLDLDKTAASTAAGVNRSLGTIGAELRELTAAPMTLATSMTSAADKVALDAKALQAEIAAFSDKINKALSGAFAGMPGAAAKASDATVPKLSSLKTAISREIDEIRLKVEKSFAPLPESATVAADATLGVVARLRTSLDVEFAGIRKSCATAFEALPEAATAAADGSVLALSRVTNAMRDATASVRALAIEAKAAAEAANAGAIVPDTGTRKPGSARGFGRAARHGAHFRPEDARVPGGHISLGSGPVIGSAAVAAYSVWEAMQSQDQALRLALTSQVDPKQLGVSTQDYLKRLMSGAVETGSFVEDVADAYSRGIRGMQGIDPKQRLDLIKTLLPTARAEAN